MTRKTSHALRRALIATAAALAAAGPAAAAELEVLHFWTSFGELRAVNSLKSTMLLNGHTWKDFAVAGGGGDAAMTALKARVLSGNAPAAAQMSGPSIQEWGHEGVLASIDDVAKEEDWDDLLPKVVADGMKYKGRYVAVPANVHRVNWLWANTEVLNRAGVKPPTSWDEFFVAAEALKRAGVIPVAHGGQPWQEFTTFESVALGLGGADFYRKAFVQLDPATLSSPRMEQVLATFKRIKQYTDKDAPGRDWNLATGMVIRGEAGMQLMGDWAKGEFIAANKQPGKDFVCVAAPGSAADFSFNVDSFAMFKIKGDDKVKAQKALASAVMATKFQQMFNLSKGSIPVRLDMKLDKFDDCAKRSAKDFAETARTGRLVPSLAHGMAAPPAVEGAMKDVVSLYWNTDAMTAKDAMVKLASAARSK